MNSHENDYELTRKERPAEHLTPDQSSRLHQTLEAECVSYATPIVLQWAPCESALSAGERKGGHVCSILHLQATACLKDRRSRCGPTRKPVCSVSWRPIVTNRMAAAH